MAAQPLTSPSLPQQIDFTALKNQETWQKLNMLRSVACNITDPMQRAQHLTQIFYAKWYGQEDPQHLTRDLKVKKELEVIEKMLSLVLNNVREIFAKISLDPASQLGRFQALLSDEAKPDFFKLHCLRESLKGHELFHKSYSLFIMTFHPRERAEQFFQDLLEHLQGSSTNSQLGSSLKVCLDKALWSRSYEDLRANFSYFPLDLENLTLLSTLAFIKGHKELAADLSRQMNSSASVLELLEVYVQVLGLVKNEESIAYLIQQMAKILPFSFAECVMDEETAKIGLIQCDENYTYSALEEVLAEPISNLKDEWKENLFCGLLKRLMLKPDVAKWTPGQLERAIQFLANNRKMPLTLEDLQNLQRSGVDFSKSNILFYLCAEGCAAEVLEFLIEQGVDLQKRHCRKTVVEFWKTRRHATAFERERFEMGIVILSGKENAEPPPAKRQKLAPTAPM